MERARQSSKMTSPVERSSVRQPQRGSCGGFVNHRSGRQQSVSVSRSLWPSSLLSLRVASRAVERSCALRWRSHHVADGHSLSPRIFSVIHRFEVCRSSTGHLQTVIMCGVPNRRTRAASPVLGRGSDRRCAREATGMQWVLCRAVLALEAMRGEMWTIDCWWWWHIPMTRPSVAARCWRMLRNSVSERRSPAPLVARKAHPRPVAGSMAPTWPWCAKGTPGGRQVPRGRSGRAVRLGRLGNGG